MPTLQGIDLSKSYRGRKVVDNVELEIGQGEVVGLLGPNGAGKTTTFYMIVGLARPDSGRVLLNSEEITDLPMYLRARSGILSASGALGLPATEQRAESAGRVGDFAIDAGTTARSPGRTTGADGLGNCAAQQGVHALRRGAPPPRNRALAHAATFLHPARRAFFRHRSIDREGLTGSHPRA